MKDKILDLIEKDELTDDEYDQLIDWVDNQIEYSDELYDFYLVIKRIETYEKEGK